MGARGERVSDARIGRETWRVGRPSLYPKVSARRRRDGGVATASTPEHDRPKVSAEARRMRAREKKRDGALEEAPGARIPRR